MQTAQNPSKRVTIIKGQGIVMHLSIEYLAFQPSYGKNKNVQGGRLSIYHSNNL